MFSKNSKNGAAPDRTTGTIIGEGITVEAGSIKGTGNVRIDGTYSGDIVLEGHLTVGIGGSVEGEIHATSALFAGSVTGNAFIKETVHLSSDSKVNGHVEAGKMIMDEDAVFKGQLSVASTQNSVQELPQPVYVGKKDKKKNQSIETEENTEENNSSR